jgi:uncharacterized tellurite resistance protein B-like protein
MVVAIAASQADGELSRKELGRLRMLAYQNRMYDTVDDVDGYIGRWAEFIDAAGNAKAVAGVIAALPARLRETAYAVAAEIVYADRKQRQSEHAFMQNLRSQLGISGQLAGKIKAVMAIRNRES